VTPSVFLTLAAIHAVAVMSPGPTFVVSVQSAVSDGALRAAVLSIGFGIGAALWASAALLGLAALFEVAPALLVALKIGGGIFLLYLGAMMWRYAKTQPQQIVDVQPTSSWGATLRKGMTTSLSNPKVAIFFGAVFAGLLPVGITVWETLIVIGLVFLVETGWYVIVGTVFSAGPARRAYTKAKVWIDRFFGGILAALGLKIMVS